MAEKSHDRFVPPAPIGTPYRSDPHDPAPFLTDADSVPVVPAESAPYREPEDSPKHEGLPKHDDDDPRTEYGAPPMFQPPNKSPARAEPLTPDQRFGRIALWVGIGSIFLVQLIAGPVAVIMGVMAIRRGEKHNGQLAIIFGLIAIAIGVTIQVLSAMGVIPSSAELWDRLKENFQQGN